MELEREGEERGNSEQWRRENPRKGGSTQQKLTPSRNAPPSAEREREREDAKQS